jgi:hypothetical protein
VPKTPVVNGSHILGGLIQRNSASSDSTDAESLPVVPLPESGEILRCLLTFIFLVVPRMASTHEETMELLSVAQKYQMRQEKCRYFFRVFFSLFSLFHVFKKSGQFTFKRHDRK